MTFCGHRNIDAADIERIKNQLYGMVNGLALMRAEEFLLGGYGAFDNLCAQVIADLKGKHPHIKSVLVVLYSDRKYDLTLYDSMEYPPIKHVPPRGAIIKRNEYMVDKSDILVAFVKKPFGGAARTLGYAERKEKKIIRIN